MMRRILMTVIVLSLVFVMGCSEVPSFNGGSAPASPEIARKAKLGSDWQMSQMRIALEVGEELSVLLKLAGGDKVDGYFYLEKGNDIGFHITGQSLLYESKALPEGLISDRFSFVSSEAQGTTYTLTFSNSSEEGGRQTKVTIFLEIIYPITGSVYIPVDTR